MEQEKKHKKKKKKRGAHGTQHWEQKNNKSDNKFERFTAKSMRKPVIWLECKLSICFYGRFVDGSRVQRATDMWTGAS